LRVPVRRTVPDVPIAGTVLTRGAADELNVRATGRRSLSKRDDLASASRAA